MASIDGYTIGDIVPWHFSVGTIVGSYIVSLCGCFLTVELLHRRATALGNWKSWAWTFGCAISMGLGGIWCMHYVGNSAIELAQDQGELQLAYNPGFTVLSLILPVIGLILAFSAAEYQTRSHWLRYTMRTTTGMIAGGCIVGMHYVGNLGITNYQLIYQPRFLAASVIIAIGACELVLILFYTWREKWINDWYKRMGCAAILAGGVTAMHFTASTGCNYRLKAVLGAGQARSRMTSVIVAAVLCGVAALIAGGVLWFWQQRTKVLKGRAEKVMLACAFFDSKDGSRIMVTNEGILPAREVTDRFNAQSFDDLFDTGHAVYQWLFRLTRVWRSVEPLVEDMRKHIGTRAYDADDTSRPGSSSGSSVFESDTYSNYGFIFKERFCLAAAHLAQSMNIPLHKLGVLYDKVIETGTLAPNEKITTRSALDIEAITQAQVFGKGQLLLLVRKVTAEEEQALLNAGLRFADVQRVSRNIAQTMQISLPALDSCINDLRGYLNSFADHGVKTGSWISFFGMLAKPHGQGFDIVVKKDAQDQLPNAKIRKTTLSWDQQEFLQPMNDMSAPACIAYLESTDEGHDSWRSDANRFFAREVLDAIMELRAQVPDIWFRQAVFYARKLEANYNKLSSPDATPTPVYAFYCIADLHVGMSSHASLDRVPFSFFAMRQRCYAGSRTLTYFEHDVREEFGAVLSRKRHIKAPNKSLKSKLSVHARQLSRRGSITEPSRNGSMVNTDGSDDTNELVDFAAKFSDVSTMRNDTPGIWGGIMVNSETVIEQTDETNSAIEMKDMGTRVAVTAATRTDERTFVDELASLCRAKYHRDKRGGWTLAG